MKTKRYELRSQHVEEFKSGPRAGERKLIALPADAIPCGIVSGHSLSLYYLVPVRSGE